jgi:hypothetical protein
MGSLFGIQEVSIKAASIDETMAMFNRYNRIDLDVRRFTPRNDNLLIRFYRLTQFLQRFFYSVDTLSDILHGGRVGEPLKRIGAKLDPRDDGGLGHV